MDIGNKIKQLRTRQGLTLEELASRSELTKGFLSQLERDLTSPSIDSLSDILEALGTNLSEFFQEDKNDQFVFRSEDFFVDERENCTVNWIVPNTQKNQMEPILLELPAGGESFEVEPHNGEEFGYVLDGSVILECGRRTQQSFAGARRSISTARPSTTSKMNARPPRASSGSARPRFSNYYIMI